MDLSDAYMQVELEEESRKYTTINTHKGLFEYTRVPFGVAPAPAIFQSTMEKTLAGIEGVIIYLDDITVTAPDDETHLKRLASVFERLAKAGFRSKKQKCEFFKERIEFLGHVIDAQGIRPSPEKVKAMVNMPEPKNIKVESFLGMVQYYGKFVPNLATLAAPLNELRQKGKRWNWGEDQKKAFHRIKKRLTEADVLAHYDPNVPVILATDASEYGLGAVIYHKFENGTEKVIAYASRTLTKQERNYAQIEKEALGIVYGVEKFNSFLYGRKFTLLTDHQPLVRIFGPKVGIPTIAAKRLHRWGLRLMAYSFDIQYKNTAEFANADGLSRLPDPRELPSAEMVIDEVVINQLADESWRDLPLSETEVAKAIQEDPVLRVVYTLVKNGWHKKNADKELQPFEQRKSELTLYKDCLMWGNRVVIPVKFKRRVLEMLHCNHFGRNRMISLARGKIWYPKMEKDIEKVVETCDTCAVYGNNPPKTPLHPWEVPSKPWQRLHMDFCEANGLMWLVVVDAKSKWPEVKPMKSTATAKTIEVLREIFSVHGLPEEIVADNGPQFASREFKEYCQCRNIELTLTPPYHPNSNGEAERFVQTFKNGLYKAVREGRKMLESARDLLFEYRVTPHPAIGMAPAEMLMGRTLRTTLDILKTEKVGGGDSQYRRSMKNNYDRKSRLRSFEVGQQVYLRNYSNRGEKWVPGIVTQVTGSNTYKVNFGYGTRLAHADQLKKRVLIEEDSFDGGGARRVTSGLSNRPRGRRAEDRPPVPLRRSTRKRKTTERMEEYQRMNSKQIRIGWISANGENKRGRRTEGGSFSDVATTAPDVGEGRSSAPGGLRHADATSAAAVWAPATVDGDDAPDADDAPVADDAADADDTDQQYPGEGPRSSTMVLWSSSTAIRSHDALWDFFHNRPKAPVDTLAGRLRLQGAEPHRIWTGPAFRFDCVSL
ncbi:hypothetical protein Y032_0025g1176 [Ancylostoma ceylanicum]|nr:hypothetical protein Y032_0025g1176 [Ancylostoma ceylanicum]